MRLNERHLTIVLHGMPWQPSEMDERNRWTRTGLARTACAYVCIADMRYACIDPLGTAVTFRIANMLAASCY